MMDFMQRFARFCLQGFQRCLVSAVLLLLFYCPNVKRSLMFITLRFLQIRRYIEIDITKPALHVLQQQNGSALLILTSLNLEWFSFVDSYIAELDKTYSVSNETTCNTSIVRCMGIINSLVHYSTVETILAVSSAITMELLRLIPVKILLFLKLLFSSFFLILVGVSDFLCESMDYAKSEDYNQMIQTQATIQP